ncbi:MAG: hypothetical protein ACLUSP_02015 [Christensenellales bacterium]
MTKTSERERSAVLTAVVGLICNLTLGAAKLVVGLISVRFPWLRTRLTTCPIAG